MAKGDSAKLVNRGDGSSGSDDAEMRLRWLRNSEEFFLE